MSKHSDTDPKEVEVTSGSQAFGFFHRHQKVIIYTAGIFTLLTFSVTAALTDVTNKLFGEGFRGATITLPGYGQVMVDEDDVNAARGISRIRSNYYRLAVFPPVTFGDERGSNDYHDQLAALHAIAKKYGIEGSDDDAEKIIQTMIGQHPNVKSVADVAAGSLIRDEALFRRWMRQALRVSTLIRMTGLGVGQTDAEAVKKILEGNEQVAYEVAYFDAKGFKDGLKKDLTDDALKKYLDGLEDAKADQYRKPANKSAILVAMLESATFDSKEFVGKEIPKDEKIGDDQVRDYYLTHREDRYKLPPKEAPEKDDEKKKGDGDKGDEAKQGDAGKKDAGKKDEGKGAPKKNDDAKKKDDEDDGFDCVAPEVDDEPQDDKKGAPKQGDPAQDPNKKPDGPGLIGVGDGSKQDNPAENQADQQAPQYKELDDALKAKLREQILAEMVLAKWQADLDKAMMEHMRAVIESVATAEIAVEDAKEAQAEADTALEKKPEDADLKKKAEAAKTKVETAEKALKAAKVAQTAQRKTFDFQAQLKKLMGDRKGLKFVPVAEMKDAEGLKELPGVGTWKDSHLPGQMSLAGEVYNGAVQSTDKGSFIFQVTDIEERPFKEFKDIKEDLEAEYLRTKAEDASKDKKEKFEKALEKLARAKLKDEVAKLEKEGKDEAKKQFDEWKKGVQDAIAKHEATLKTEDPTTRVYKGAKALLDSKKADLEKADDKKKEIDEAEEKKTEGKIEEKLAEVHKDVLAAAAKESGMTFEKIGPFPRKLRDEPRFEHAHKNVVKAVYGDTDVQEYEVDDTSELKEDGMNEVTFMAVCRSVQDSKVTHVSRRQWLQKKQGDHSGSFAGQRMMTALNQSYTMKALEKGYKWTRPRSEEDDEPGIADPNKKKDGDKKDAADKGKKKKGDG